MLGTYNSRPSQPSGDSGSTGFIQIQESYRQPLVASSKEFSPASTPVAPSPVSTTVRVTIHGAVRNSGVYEVPAGPNSLLAAIALAGGLRPDYRDVIKIKRRAQGVRKVQTQGVEPASHSESSTYKQTIAAKIKDVKTGTQLVSLQDGDDVHVTVAESGRLTPPESWGKVFSLRMPSGFRTATTQVKNYEFRLKKAQVVLEAAREEARYSVAQMDQHVKSLEAKDDDARLEKAREVLERTRSETREAVAQFERNLKSLELQLKAAKSLVRPRPDFVAQYDVDRFGDQLADQSIPNVRAYAVGKIVSQANKPAEKVLDELSEVIQSTIAPSSWKSGVGTVKPNLNTRSLVVRATDEVHNQIGQLLKQISQISKVSTRMYHVADLVTPIPGSDGDLASNVAELMARVRAIFPESWKVAGGRNSVEFKSLSFKIRANTQIHDAVVKTLTDLRNRQPGQVMLSVNVIEVSGKVPELAAKRPGEMVSLVADDFDIGGKRLMAPQLTLSSGTTAEVRRERLHMKFRAKVEGRKVIVTAIVGGKATSWVIPDGRTGLADMTESIGKNLGFADGKRYYLTVKADLIKHVEEEEPVPGPVVREPTGSDKSGPQPAGDKRRVPVIQDGDVLQYDPAGPEFKLSNLEERLGQYRQQQQGQDDD